MTDDAFNHQPTPSPEQFASPAAPVALPGTANKRDTARWLLATLTIVVTFLTAGTIWSVLAERARNEKLQDQIAELRSDLVDVRVKADMLGFDNEQNSSAVASVSSLERQVAQLNDEILRTQTRINELRQCTNDGLEEVGNGLNGQDWTINFCRR